MVINLNRDLSDKIIDFIHEAGVLKNTRRTGWQWRGIQNCESLADHSYRVVLLSMVLADALVEKGEKLNMEKLLRMATLHEICEARIGDIPFPAVKYIGKKVKKAAEAEAVREMTEPLGNFGAKYSQIFNEFEECDSIEAKIVRAADKLEMMLQAWEYELCGNKGLQDFFDNIYTFKDIEINDLLKDISKKLINLRTQNLENASSNWQQSESEEK